MPKKKRDFPYVLANQDPATPAAKNERFELQRFLEQLPRPRGKYEDQADKLADRAFHWVVIPNAYPFASAIYAMRLRFPAFQFDYAIPAQGWVTTGKYKGTRGRMIRCRYDPKLWPTKQDPEPFPPTAEDLR